MLLAKTERKKHLGRKKGGRRRRGVTCFEARGSGRGRHDPQSPVVEVDGSLDNRGVDGSNDFFRAF